MNRAALLYENALASSADTGGFILEGEAQIGFHEDTLRLASQLDETLGQRANDGDWCPRAFPTAVWLEWDFWPEHSHGICILFFGARGRKAEDLFDPALTRRSGEYQQ